MSSLALFNWELSVKNEGGYPIHRTPPPRRFAPGAGANGTVQSVSLTGSAYTPITVPTGAKFMAIILGLATSLTYKGNTADVGVPITPATNPTGLDFFTPLAGSPTPGILNGLSTAQVVEIIFL